MIIMEVHPIADYILRIKTIDGIIGSFDIKPYLALEAFVPLNQPPEFLKITNGGYFIEWNCGADLSADTIEAKMFDITNKEPARHI